MTWRGKTYVGTLLDCTKHDWAPPRYVLVFFSVYLKEKITTNSVIVTFIVIMLIPK